MARSFHHRSGDGDRVIEPANKADTAALARAGHDGPVQTYPAIPGRQATESNKRR